jgi:hypothetical protein
MARLRAEWRSAASGADLRAVQGRLLALALEGSVPALRLWLQYVIGRPDRSVDLDELDLHEMELAIKQARLLRQAREAGVEAGPAPAPPAPAPAGRPEAEWRRSEAEPRKAEPPAGSRPCGPALGQAAEALRAAPGTMEGGEGQPGVPIRTMTVTTVPTVRRPAGAAPGGGARGGGG